MTKNTQSDIEFNIKAHNKVAENYAAIHGEIYNQIEQARLSSSLKEAMALILCRDAGTRMRVLDLGCGAGNLTDHLVSLGAEVIASDVSPKFLIQIRQRHVEPVVETLQLNGNNLSNIDTATLDMVATYSVLHHIPDYLHIIDECMRVLKPGGILYLDHEVPDEYWGNIATLKKFYRKAQSFGPHLLVKFLRPENYIDFLIRKFRNPRYRREGDIHVFPDDHIEWKKIAARVSKSGGLLFQRDYLLFRFGFKAEIYETYKNTLSDMRLAIFRKHE